MASESFAPGALLGRELSTAVILFHQAVAERAGLTATDWKCLDLLDRMGPLTAGQLADEVGLTRCHHRDDRPFGKWRVCSA